MIRSFRCGDTEKLFHGQRVRRFQSSERTALRKLIHLNQARFLSDLGAIPGNRLELLKGDRDGQHSIRINDQYRICFLWKENDRRAGDAYEVEIVDYH